ncbi:MAG: NAD(P)-binding domain-containing protein [Planctomycetota bacterium]
MSESSMHERASDVDTLLVGAGPIGIEMAAALRSLGHGYAHVEAGCLASTIAWYPPGTEIFSAPERLAIAGVPFVSYPHQRVTREDYLAYLRGVVAHHGLEVSLFTRVTSIERTADGRLCATVAPSRQGVGGPGYSAKVGGAGAADGAGAGAGGEIRCSNVILGIGDMHVPRMLGIEGEGLAHVSHFMGDPHVYAQLRVVVVGGNNSACEAAVRLYRAGARVTLVHRRAEPSGERVKPWIAIELKALIREGKVDFLGERVLGRIERERVRADSIAGDGEVVVAADRVLLMTGYDQDASLFERLGVELRARDRAPVFDRATMQTGVPGVYVLGTAVSGSRTGRTVHFIETSHKHVPRIARALGHSAAAQSGAGDAFPWNLEAPDRPEDLRES